MITINIIDSASGLLKSTVTCDADHVAEQAHAGETAINTPVPQGLAAPIRWNVSAWETVLPPLAELKLAKWAQIKAQAALSDQSDMLIGANTYSLDLASRAAFFQQAQIAVQNGTSVTWHTVTDDPVTLTLAQVKAGVTAIAARSDAIRSKALTLRAIGVAATTPAQVAAIVWQWP